MAYPRRGADVALASVGWTAAGLLLLICVCAVAVQLRNELAGSHREHRPWELDAVDGREIAVVVEYGGCDGFEGLEVTETAADVAIAAVVRVPDRRDVDCNAVLTAECAYHTLSDPLGSRPLLHAAGEIPPAPVREGRHMRCAERNP